MTGTRQKTLVAEGASDLAQQVLARLGARDEVFTDLPTLNDPGEGDLALVLPLMQDSAADEDDLAAQITAPVEILKAMKRDTGRYPNRMVVIAPRQTGGSTSAATSALSAVVRYVSGHLIKEDIRINTVLCGLTDAGRAAAVDVTFALTSGLLDDMHGQTLELEERDT